MGIKQRKEAAAKKRARLGLPDPAPVGRPAMFKTAADLQKKVNEYFEYVKGEVEIIEELDMDCEIRTYEKWKRHPEPITITGLVLHLGFCSRQSMGDYESYPERPEFSDIIKRARARVESSYERRLDSNSPTGAIFALKNMGWRDRSEIAPVTPDGDPLQFSPLPIQITVVPAPKDDD